MAAIAAYRTAILALLDDASKVRYTDNQVDQAIRQTLVEYSQAHPLVATYNADGYDTYRFELPVEFQPMAIMDVQLHDETVNPPVSLLFAAFCQDSQWILETKDYLVSADETVDIVYSTTHLIDGLDDGDTTTIPAEDESAVQMGAAGYAALMRAVSRSETVNLQPGVQKALLDLSTAFLASFREAIHKPLFASFTDFPDMPVDVF